MSATEPTPMVRALEELWTFFAAAASLQGLHAAPWEGGGGALVWDDRRSRAEHARRVAFAMSRTPVTLRAVTATVNRLRDEAPEAWTACLVVLTPRRWPEALGRRMARPDRCGSLVGQLLRSNRLRRAYPGDDQSPPRLLRYAAAKAEALGASESSKRAFFDPLIDEAEGGFQLSLAAYDVLRRERVEAERRAHRGARDRCVADMRGSLT